MEPASRLVFGLAGETPALLAHRRNRLFEDLDSGVGFVLGDDERRRNSNGARTATQEQDAALEGRFHDAITFFGSVFASLLVLDDLNADHQTAATYIANQPVLLRPVRHALEHVIAHFGRVLEQVLLLDDIERRQRSRDAHRIAAEGGG